MRARSRRLRHPQGGHVETPLLVPSFSSKGFDVVKRRNRLVSEVAQYLQFFAHQLNRTFLVSAYDLHHRLLHDAAKVRRRFDETAFSHPEILFVDSGLYELRIDADAGEPLQEMRLPRDWSEELYIDYVGKLPAKATNLAVVNWDSYQSYRVQIAAAQEFFVRRHGEWLSVFLLKPEKRGSIYDLQRLVPEVERLAAFHVIGVTEKELGRSVIERVAAVARLRSLLDDNDVKGPLHVFGGLDPLYSPLYFAAGAEIFDGLGWLRYAFVDGLPVHRDGWPILFGQNDNQQQVLSAQANNLQQLERLERAMKRFRREGDWSVYGERTASLLQDAYLGVESEVNE